MLEQTGVIRQQAGSCGQGACAPSGLDNVKVVVHLCYSNFIGLCQDTENQVSELREISGFSAKLSGTLAPRAGRLRGEQKGIF